MKYNGKTIADLKHWESRFEFILTYGVVVLGDVLGTKGIWREKDSSDVIQNWIWLMEKTKDFLKLQFPKIDVKVRAFSDTILITYAGSNIEELIIGVGLFFNQFLSICLVYDFPIRGVFSLGEFVDSNQMIIGPAIDESASFYEQSNWIGFSATPSAFSLIEKLSKSKTYSDRVNKFFIKYDVPLKNGIDKQNWVIRIDPEYVLSGNFTQKSNFLNMSIRDIINYKLQHPSNPDAGIKWKNLLLFID